MHPNSNTLSDTVRKAVDNTAFWDQLKKSTDYLLPFVSILDHLQRDAANIYDAATSFGYVAQQYQKDENTSIGLNIITTPGLVPYQLVLKLR